MYKRKCLLFVDCKIAKDGAKNGVKSDINHVADEQKHRIFIGIFTVIQFYF